MRSMKVAALLSIGLLLTISAAITAQDEEEGLVAKDTPYFSGMPNYKIADSYDREFDDYRFFDGKDCVTAEGKKSHRAYTVKEDAKPASELQISRNYANAVKEMGGTVVFEGICEGADCAENCGYRMMVGKVQKGDNELWVEIVPFNDGNDYYLTLVAKESMKQDVTASGMLDALNRDGHVTLYINFDFGKSVIKTESMPIVEQIIKMMKANESLELSVEGHTDSVGDSKSNQLLAEGRAKAVVGAIVFGGIDMKRLSAVGFGEEKPIASNDTEEGRAKNRRVELVKRTVNPYTDPASRGSKEHFGVPVYPGATLDAEQTEFAKFHLGNAVFVYRTSDKVAVVSAFYMKTGRLKSIGADETSAVFMKDEEGSSVRVAISSPWTDPKTGESHSDTMIQILKGE